MNFIKVAAGKIFCWQNQSAEKFLNKVIPLKDKLAKVLRTIRNILIGLIVLTALVVGAFVAAIKFDVLDTEDVAMLNEELGLYRLPFVGNGRYFEVPEGVEWPPPPEPEPEPEPEPPKPEPEPEVKVEPPKEEPKPKKEDKPKEVKIDKKAIDEQKAKREAEEKKRLARLARIYESMKPEQAANALINVDWDTTVLIFLLAKMEPEAAAQLTEMLYAGTQRRVTTPSDTMRNEPVTEPEQISTAE